MRLLAGLASYLPFMIQALTIANSKSVSVASGSHNPSQPLNPPVLGRSARASISATVSNASLQNDLSEDSNITVSLLYPNASHVGARFDTSWNYKYKFFGTRLCATAALVDAAYALATMALDGVRAEQTFSVISYDEVKIKVTSFTAAFTRQPVAVAMYVALHAMNTRDKFEASRFTFLESNEEAGKIEFMATPSASYSCGASQQDASSSPLVGPGPSSNDSSSVASRSNGGASRSAATTLVNATTNDDDPDMELDCEWFGKRVHPRTALLAPSSVMAYSEIMKRDPMSLPPIREVIKTESLDMTFIMSAAPQYHHAAPLWTYYWIIKALGKMPEKMADQLDWREMSVKVKVDGFQIGTIGLFMGILPTVSGLALQGSDNDSTLIV